MPFNLAAGLAIVAGASAAGLTLATWIVSERFFQRLIAQHPEFANSFPRTSMLARYELILSTKMAYLHD
jgi:hypothetical protein